VRRTVCLLLNQLHPREFSLPPTFPGQALSFHFPLVSFPLSVFELRLCDPHSHLCPTGFFTGDCEDPAFVFIIIIFLSRGCDVISLSFFAVFLCPSSLDTYGKGNTAFYPRTPSISAQGRGGVWGVLGPFALLSPSAPSAPSASR
jgi:hypothetical protein